VHHTAGFAFSVGLGQHIKGLGSHKEGLGHHTGAPRKQKTQIRWQERPWGRPWRGDYGVCGLFLARNGEVLMGSSPSESGIVGGATCATQRPTASTLVGACGGLDTVCAAPRACLCPPFTRIGHWSLAGRCGASVAPDIADSYPSSLRDGPRRHECLRPPDLCSFGHLAGVTVGAADVAVAAVLFCVRCAWHGLRCEAMIYSQSVLTAYFRPMQGLRLEAQRAREWAEPRRGRRRRQTLSYFR